MRFADSNCDITWANARQQLIEIIIDADDLGSLKTERGLTIVQTIPQVSLCEYSKALDGYKNSTQLYTILQSFANQYPEITHLSSIGETTEKRPIWCLKISDNPQIVENEPSAIMVGAHHARELMSIEAVLDIIETLLAGYASHDPEIMQWIQNYQILCVPMVNPDGVDYVFTKDNWWRKNRKMYSSTVFGVDLNRNYSFMWGINNDGSSPTPSSVTYRGSAPMSEEESQAMCQLANIYRPIFALSYHSYGEVVLYPYGCEVAKNPIGDSVQQVAQELASSIIGDDGEGCYEFSGQLYPVNGLDRDWYYHDFGTFGFVLEISNSSRGFQPSYSQWRNSTVTGLRPGWKYILRRMSGPMISGQVLDAITQQPIAATIALAEIQFQEQEIRKTNQQFGTFYWPAKQGTYHLQVTHPDYADYETTVQVESTPTNVTILLQKK